MKKTLLMVAAFGFAAALTTVATPWRAAAGDEAAQPTKLLFESTGMGNVRADRRSRANASAVTQTACAPVSVVEAVCAPEPAKTVCAPAPAVADCPPAPCGSVHTATGFCSATPACPPQGYKVKEVPVRMVVEEMKMVPTKRRVVEEEYYLDHEKRTGTYNETRTRTAKRTITLPTTKMVSEAKYIHVKPNYGSATRLARGVNRKVVVTTRKAVQEYQEEYIQPVKYHFTVPVTKSRKVTKTVEDYKLVPFRRTVTATETRLVPAR